MDTENIINRKFLNEESYYISILKTEDPYKIFRFGKHISTWHSGRKTLNTDPIEYHTYGFNWTKDRVEFLYDGRVVRVVANRPDVISHTPQEKVSLVS